MLLHGFRCVVFYNTSSLSCIRLLNLFDLSFTIVLTDYIIDIFFSKDIFSFAVQSVSEGVVFADNATSSIIIRLLVA